MTYPWRKGAGVATAEDRSPRRRTEGSGPRRARVSATYARPLVLIVEDDADARELYACCMRAAGWEVATATNGVDAIGIAAAIEPHVIVMDIDMPRLDGIEATRRLRSSRQTADIPVVACTASGRDRVSELEQVGFDELVAKPCTAEELCRVVEKLIAAR